MEGSCPARTLSLANTSTVGTLNYLKLAVDNHSRDTRLILTKGIRWGPLIAGQGFTKLITFDLLNRNARPTTIRIILTMFSLVPRICNVLVRNPERRSALEFFVLLIQVCSLPTNYT